MLCCIHFLLNTTFKLKNLYIFVMRRPPLLLTSRIPSDLAALTTVFNKLLANSWMHITKVLAEWAWQDDGYNPERAIKCQHYVLVSTLIASDKASSELTIQIGCHRKGNIQRFISSLEGSSPRDNTPWWEADKRSNKKVNLSTKCRGKMLGKPSFCL